MDALLVGQISRDELFRLHAHYESVIKDQLDFFFKYLNFYIGLLSALLAATLTGLFSNDIGYPLKYTLVSGPLLIILLSFIGQSTVKVFYRRFVEAWVTVRNIQAMLGLTDNLGLANGIRAPLYRSRYGGGFITQFERPVIKKVLEKAGKESWPAEKVLEETLKHGDTLKYAKTVFFAFILAAAALFFIITI